MMTEGSMRSTNCPPQTAEGMDYYNVFMHKWYIWKPW
jgi:predicted glutamine amidotransferase